MSDNLVCPDCGSAEFHADHHATVRRTYRVAAGQSYADHVSEEVIDVDRDYDALICDDCGSEHQEGDPVTEDAYNADNDFES